MPTRFKSTYSPCEAFYLRVDLLRPEFGRWDPDDPVSHAILDVVEAQREIAGCFLDDEECVGNAAAFTAAVKKRHAAGKRLMALLEDRDSWPDPKLGQ